MPLYMDIHANVDATPEEVSEAHLLDVEIQDKYKVCYHTYWFNTENRKIFCLMEAPSREAAETVHREAHGLLADEIIEVEARMVQDFMGIPIKTYPGAQQSPETGSLDGGFRTIMFTDMEGSTPLMHRLGDERGVELIRLHNATIQECLRSHYGSQVKHTGDGVLASFASVTRALDCSIDIQRAIEERNAKIGAEAFLLRIGMGAGEPIEESQDLFGTTVNLAARTCAHAQPGQILASNVVRELAMGKRYRFGEIGDVALKGFDTPVRLHEVHWRDGDVPIRSGPSF